MSMFLICVMVVFSTIWNLGVVWPEWSLMTMEVFSIGIVLLSVVVFLSQWMDLRKAKVPAVVHDIEDPELALLRRSLQAAEKEIAAVKAHNVAKVSTDEHEKAIFSFLGLLQKEGRFLDFMMDDVAQYGDEEIGAAARLVHQGCQKVMTQHFKVEAVVEQEEGAQITLQEDYSSEKYRLIGSVTFPCQGQVVHRGWQIKECTLPEPVGKSHRVVTPAEVEVGGVR